MMLSFDVGTLKFNYRVVGIIIHEGRVLFQRSVGSDFWFLPGGRVEFLETAEEALKREMIEEFSMPVGDCKLAFLLENFFDSKGRQFHEIGLFFTAQPLQNHSVLSQIVEFTGVEKEYANKWIPFEEIPEYNIFPVFLKKKLLEFVSTRIDRIEHIINNAVGGSS